MALTGDSQELGFRLALQSGTTDPLAEYASRASDIKDLVRMLSDIGNIEVRARAQAQLLEVADNHAERLGEAMATIQDWALSDFLGPQGSSVRTPAEISLQLERNYPAFTAAAQKGVRSRNNKEVYRKAVVDAWGRGAARLPTLQAMLDIENTGRGLQALAKAYRSNFEAARCRLNGAMLHRVTNPKRGVRTERRFLRGDAEAAADKSKTFLPSSERELMRMEPGRVGMVMGSDGFLRMAGVATPASGTPMASPQPTIRTLDTETQSTPRPGSSGSALALHQRKPSLPYGSTFSLGSISHPTSPGVRSAGDPATPLARYGSEGFQYGNPEGSLPIYGQTPLLYGSQRASPAPGTSAFAPGGRLDEPFGFGVSPGGSPARGREHSRERSRERSQSRPADTTGLSVYGTPPGVGGPAAAAKARHRRASSIEGGARRTVSPLSQSISPLSQFVSPYASASPAAQVIETRTKCGCDKDRASATLLSRLHDNPAIRGQEEQAKYLNLFVRSLNGQADTSVYCYRHTFTFAQALGFRVVDATHAVNTSRLWYMHRDGIRDLAGYRVRRDKYEQFTKGSRGPVPSDELGPYRFFKKREIPTYFEIASSANRAAIARAIGFSSEQAKAWERDGTINFGGLFDYWKEYGLMDPIREEFKMYRWHLRRINNRSNYGWSRAMVYSLVQQLVRQDPGYWLLYVLLRPDCRAWLISYPYYTKDQTPGDRTGFRHIDLNIPGMIGPDRRGLDQVQGTVSIDDEYDDDCTILVPKMQRHLVDWGTRLAQRGGLGSSYIHKIDDKVLTVADLKRYGTDWTRVPCRALQVRISHPALPHGAQGPAKHHRRTILPWFCGINKSHTHLDIAEAGTWAEISTAHRTMSAPKSSPSGFPNMYGAIPYAFPAAVQLDGLGPISDALVGRRPWTDPEVALTIHEMLDAKDPVAAIKAYLKAWRKLAAERYQHQLKKVAFLEKSSFAREKSFFAMGRDMSKVGPSDFSPADAASDDDDAEGQVELELPLEE